MKLLSEIKVVEGGVMEMGLPPLKLPHDSETTFDQKTQESCTKVFHEREIHVIHTHEEIN